MVQEAERREVWDKRRRGICVKLLLFSIFVNDLVRKVLRKKGRKDES